MPALPSLRISELPKFTGDITTLYFPANVGFPAETYTVPFSTLRTQILNEATVQGNLLITQNLSANGSFIVGSYNHQTEITTLEGFTNGTTLSTLKPTTSINFILSPNSIYSYKITVAAYEVSTNYANSFEFSGVIKRDSSNATTIVGYPTKIINVQEDANVDVNISANNTNKSLDVVVKGSTGSAYRWTASVYTTNVRV
jgi:hypothetical protein